MSLTAVRNKYDGSAIRTHPPMGLKMYKEFDGKAESLRLGFGGDIEED